MGSHPSPHFSGPSLLLTDPCPRLPPKFLSKHSEEVSLRPSLPASVGLKPNPTLPYEGGGCHSVPLALNLAHISWGAESPALRGWPARSQGQGRSPRTRPEQGHGAQPSRPHQVLQAACLLRGRLGTAGWAWRVSAARLGSLHRVLLLRGGRFAAPPAFADLQVHFWLLRPKCQTERLGFGDRVQERGAGLPWAGSSGCGCHGPWGTCNLSACCAFTLLSS